MTGTVGGVVAPGFERVAEVMGNGATVVVGEGDRRRRREADFGDGGGAFCAFVDGECVADLWTGWAGEGRPWEEATRAVIMSSTKGLTARCARMCSRTGAHWTSMRRSSATGRSSGRRARDRPRCANCSATSRAPSGCPAPMRCSGGTVPAGTTPRPSQPRWRRASRPGSPARGTATTASPSAGSWASWYGGSAGAASASSSSRRWPHRSGRPAPSGPGQRRSTRWPP